MPIQPAQRIQALPPYLFVEIDRKKRAALDAGRDVIDFGVGDPDQPTPAFIRDRLRAVLDEPAHHRYPLGIGSLRFRRAVAEMFAKRFGVGLRPESEIIALIGSKEGLGHLPLAIVDPGQTVLIPDPAYPVYESGTIFAGGVPCKMPLSAERGWQPNFDAIPADAARRAVLMFLNYPNNPTGAVADRALLERAVAFARRHEIILAYDAAYSEMYYDPADRPPSVLEVRGAKEVAVELHSLSKTFNMTGWRVAFAVGHPDVLAALAKIKSNVDSGVFSAIQEAAIAAYEGLDRPEISANRELYAERGRRMAAGLRDLGFSVAPPRATFYIWAATPGGAPSMQAAARLLDEADVVAVPGVGFGRMGEGYLRFAMTVDAPRIDEALRRMRALRW